MAYFIFTNNSDNIEGTLYRIAENQFDLDNLNIDKSIYKIIEDSQLNFEDVKCGLKTVLKYNNNTIIYENAPAILIKDKINKNGIMIRSAKEELNDIVSSYKEQIKQFIKNNPNHLLLNRWNNYYNQLNSLNLDNITYPFTKTLEQYFKDQNQTYLNPLQIP
jgi:hypothetical protein